MLYGKSFGEVLVESQVDSTAITAAARTTMLPAAAKFTLPANFFDRIGKQLLIQASGRFSTVVTTPGTFRIDVDFGGTIVFDTNAIALATADAYTNRTWFLQLLMTCRAIGATANLFTQGFLAAENIAGAPATPPKGALVAMLPWNAAPAVGPNFSSIVSQQVDVFFTQTVATGSWTTHQYSLISLN